MHRKVSIFCDFPEVNEEWIDTKLEEDMDHVLQIVVQGRACRNTANIKNRQPIGKMYVKAAFELSDFYKDIIADELMSKKLSSQMTSAHLHLTALNRSCVQLVRNTARN